MGSRLINAQAESVHYKPSFGAAFCSRRCLVSANGWFEWQPSGHGKQPYFLGLADGSPPAKRFVAGQSLDVGPNPCRL